MKAALLVEPGKVVVGDVPDPEPGDGEVRIAVRGVGLCGSDASVFTGRWDAPSYPWIMGHEAFGVIEAVGPGVPADRVGEIVVVEPNAPCRTCDQCGLGRTSACRNRSSLGMNRPGALAELLVVPGRCAWSMPALPEEDLVCVEPATVVVAALRRLGTPPPDEVLVVGIGAQGMMMTLVLADRGVAVFGADVNPQRVAFATSLGGAGPVPDPERRFPLVVDTVGSPGSMASALGRLEIGGTLLCLGLDSRPVEVSSRDLVRGQVTVRGSLTYDHPTDFAATTALIAAGEFAPGRVVTDEYPLAEAQAAFDGAASARGKTWIRIAAGS